MDTLTETRTRFQHMALECAAMPVHVGMRTIDGNAVIAISSYARTLRGVTEEERLAIIGQAFDIYAGAVRSEQS